MATNGHKFQNFLPLTVIVCAFYVSRIRTEELKIVKPSVVFRDGEVLKSTKTFHEGTPREVSKIITEWDDPSSSYSSKTYHWYSDDVEHPEAEYESWNETVYYDVPVDDQQSYQVSNITNVTEVIVEEYEIPDVHNTNDEVLTLDFRESRHPTDVTRKVKTVFYDYEIPPELARSYTIPKLTPVLYRINTQSAVTLRAYLLALAAKHRMVKTMKDKTISVQKSYTVQGTTKNQRMKTIHSYSRRIPHGDQIVQNSYSRVIPPDSSEEESLGSYSQTAPRGYTVQRTKNVHSYSEDLPHDITAQEMKTVRTSSVPQEGIVQTVTVKSHKRPHTVQRVKKVYSQSPSSDITVQKVKKVYSYSQEYPHDTTAQTSYSQDLPHESTELKVKRVYSQRDLPDTTAQKIKKVNSYSRDSTEQRVTRVHSNSQNLPQNGTVQKRKEVQNQSKKQGTKVQETQTEWNSDTVPYDNSNKEKITRVYSYSSNAPGTGTNDETIEETNWKSRDRANSQTVKTIHTYSETVPYDSTNVEVNEKHLYPYDSTHDEHVKRIYSNTQYVPRDISNEQKIKILNSKTTPQDDDSTERQNLKTMHSYTGSFHLDRANDKPPSDINSKSFPFYSTTNHKVTTTHSSEYFPHNSTNGENIKTTHSFSKNFPRESINGKNIKEVDWNNKSLPVHSKKMQTVKTTHTSSEFIPHDSTNGENIETVDLNFKTLSFDSTQKPPDNSTNIKKEQTTQSYSRSFQQDSTEIDEEELPHESTNEQNMKVIIDSYSQALPNISTDGAKNLPQSTKDETVKTTHSYSQTLLPRDSTNSEEVKVLHWNTQTLLENSSDDQSLKLLHSYSKSVPYNSTDDLTIKTSHSYSEMSPPSSASIEELKTTQSKWQNSRESTDYQNTVHLNSPALLNDSANDEKVKIPDLSSETIPHEVDHIEYYSHDSSNGEETRFRDWNSKGLLNNTTNAETFQKMISQSLPNHSNNSKIETSATTEQEVKAVSPNNSSYDSITDEKLKAVNSNTTSSPSIPEVSTNQEEVKTVHSDAETMKTIHSYFRMLPQNSDRLENRDTNFDGHDLETTMNNGRVFTKIETQTMIPNHVKSEVATKNGVQTIQHIVYSPIIEKHYYQTSPTGQKVLYKTSQAEPQFGNDNEKQISESKTASLTQIMVNETEPEFEQHVEHDEKPMTTSSIEEHETTNEKLNHSTTRTKVRKSKINNGKRVTHRKYYNGGTKIRTVVTEYHTNSTKDPNQSTEEDEQSEEEHGASHLQVTTKIQKGKRNHGKRINHRRGSKTRTIIEYHTNGTGDSTEEDMEYPQEGYGSTNESHKVIHSTAKNRKGKASHGRRVNNRKHYNRGSRTRTVIKYHNDVKGGPYENVEEENVPTEDENHEAISGKHKSGTRVRKVNHRRYYTKGSKTRIINEHINNNNTEDLHEESDENIPIENEDYEGTNGTRRIVYHTTTIQNIKRKRGRKVNHQKHYIRGSNGRRITDHHTYNSTDEPYESMEGDERELTDKRHKANRFKTTTQRSKNSRGRRIKQNRRGSSRRVVIHDSNSTSHPHNSTENEQSEEEEYVDIEDENNETLVHPRTKPQTRRRKTKHRKYYTTGSRTRTIIIHNNSSTDGSYNSQENETSEENYGINKSRRVNNRKYHTRGSRIRTNTEYLTNSTIDPYEEEVVDESPRATTKTRTRKVNHGRKMSNPKYYTRGSKTRTITEYHTNSTRDPDEEELEVTDGSLQGPQYKTKTRTRKVNYGRRVNQRKHYTKGSRTRTITEYYNSSKEESSENSEELPEDKEHEPTDERYKLVQFTTRGRTVKSNRGRKVNQRKYYTRGSKTRIITEYQTNNTSDPDGSVEERNEELDKEELDEIQEVKEQRRNNTNYSSNGEETRTDTEYNTNVTRNPDENMEEDPEDPDENRKLIHSIRTIQRGQRNSGRRSNNRKYSDRGSKTHTVIKYQTSNTENRSSDEEGEKRGSATTEHRKAPLRSSKGNVSYEKRVYHPRQYTSDSTTRIITKYQTNVTRNPQENIHEANKQLKDEERKVIYESHKTGNPITKERVNQSNNGKRVRYYTKGSKSQTVTEYHTSGVKNPQEEVIDENYKFDQSTSSRIDKGNTGRRTNNRKYYTKGSRSRTVTEYRTGDQRTDGNMKSDSSTTKSGTDKSSSGRRTTIHKYYTKGSRTRTNAQYQTSNTGRQEGQNEEFEFTDESTLKSQVRDVNRERTATHRGKYYTTGGPVIKYNKERHEPLDETSSTNTRRSSKMIDRSTKSNFRAKNHSQVRVGRTRVRTTKPQTRTHIKTRSKTRPHKNIIRQGHRRMKNRKHNGVSTERITLCEFYKYDEDYVKQHCQNVTLPIDVHGNDTTEKETIMVILNDTDTSGEDAANFTKAEEVSFDSGETYTEIIFLDNSTDITLPDESKKADEHHETKRNSPFPIDYQ